jgi:hypothetical protein
MLMLTSFGFLSKKEKAGCAAALRGDSVAGCYGGLVTFTPPLDSSAGSPLERGELTFETDPCSGSGALDLQPRRRNGGCGILTVHERNCDPTPICHIRHVRPEDGAVRQPDGFAMENLIAF